MARDAANRSSLPLAVSRDERPLRAARAGREAAGTRMRQAGARRPGRRLAGSCTSSARVRAIRIS